MRGSIRRRGKRSYQIRVYLGDHRPGADPYIARSAKTKQEADAILTGLLGQVQSGGYIPPAKQTVGHYLEDWMATYIQGRREASTVYGYKNIVRQVQAAPLGAMPVHRVTGQALDAYYTAKLRAGLSGTTVRGHHRVLSSAFGKAVKQRQLVQNPCVFASPPDATTPETAALDEEQIALFLGRAKRESVYYPLYLTAALTGLRQSELAGLRWAQISLRDPALVVTQAFLRIGQLQVWKGPKSKAGRRPVALSEALVSVLPDMPAEQDRAKAILTSDYHHDDLVFCQGDGKPLHMRNVYQRDFLPLLERCGLPRVTFQSLRHSNISISARAGVDLSVTQRRAGHSTPTVTLGIYRHVLDAEDRAAARAVEARLIHDHGIHGQIHGQKSEQQGTHRAETLAELDDETDASQKSMRHLGAKRTSSGNP